MLNFLWLFMILAGIVYAAFTGNLQAVTDAALDSAQQAVAICITMAGVLAFWVGLMQIAENAGMMRRAAERIYPLLHFLFPRGGKIACCSMKMEEKFFEEYSTHGTSVRGSRADIRQDLAASLEVDETFQEER